jgi:hypothetical protein
MLPPESDQHIYSISDKGGYKKEKAQKWPGKTQMDGDTENCSGAFIPFPIHDQLNAIGGDGLCLKCEFLPHIIVTNPTHRFAAELAMTIIKNQIALFHKKITSSCTESCFDRIFTDILPFRASVAGQCLYLLFLNSKRLIKTI